MRAQRFSFWLLSFGFHTLVIAIAALLSIVIEMPGDGERDFVLLVSPVESSEWVWFDPVSPPHEAPESETEVADDGIPGSDRSVPDLWDVSDYIISENTENDSSKLHRIPFIRRNARLIEDDNSRCRCKPLVSHTGDSTAIYPCVCNVADPVVFPCDCKNWMTPRD